MTHLTSIEEIYIIDQELKVVEDKERRKELLDKRKEARQKV
jgi:hypothetical protein